MGEVIGQSGLLVQTVDGETEAELAYALMEKSRGVGYATEAALAVRDYAFHELKFTRLVSIIALTNTRSKKVAQRAGMSLEKTTVFERNPVEVYSLQNDGS